MEPENNMENMENEAPEVEEMAAEEVVVSEENPVVDEAPKKASKDDIVFNDKPKKKTGMILCMILLFLIAAGGIGFGVWAWMDGNSQKDSLNAQINSLKEQNSKLLEQLRKESEDVIIDVETETGTEAETNSGANSGTSSSVNPADYIYVGEWGIKIKKPENWRNSVREYGFYNGYPQATDTLEIRENSQLGGGVMVGMGGESCETQVAAAYGTCFVVDGKVIIVTEMVGETTLESSSAISDTFRNHFMDSGNYSKI